MRLKILCLTFAAALAAPALATPAGETARPEEARIPFVSFRSVRNYHPVSDEIVYLQSGRNWYRATLAVPCHGIQSGIRIGVDTRFGDTLDNTSSFLVDGQRCPIFSLVRSGPPPERRRRG